MLVCQLARGARTCCFSIRDTRGQGWELTEERDRRTVRTVRYTDWHRVELAATLISLEVAALEREGWTVTRGSSWFNESVP
ncbi:MAG TPA: hypothetical protein VK886_07315 [Vicinamibacterales bacterium]|nr:hypothetical protein [Vicinamibacterales bacterium]